MQVKNKKSLINFRAPATNNFMINSQEGSLLKGQIGNQSSGQLQSMSTPKGQNSINKMSLRGGT